MCVCVCISSKSIRPMYLFIWNAVFVIYIARKLIASAHTHKHRTTHAESIFQIAWIHLKIAYLSIVHMLNATFNTINCVCFSLHMHNWRAGERGRGSAARARAHKWMSSKQRNRQTFVNQIKKYLNERSLNIQLYYLLGTVPRGFPFRCMLNGPQRDSYSTLGFD